MILRVDIHEKSFTTADGGTRAILKDLKFELGEREIVALVGPSGCGKTTLLKLIGGLDTQFNGTIAWNTNSAPRIGTVFQEPRLLPWRTVRQNVDLVLPADVDRAATEALLEVLGLWPFRDAYPSQLSLGMARRAAIARAFAIAPEIVLLDEPFVSLDAAMAAISRGILLTAWNRQPTAALLVTHDMGEAVALADRVLILSTSPTHIVQEIVVPPDLLRTDNKAAVHFVEQLRNVVADGGTMPARDPAP